MTIPTNTDYLRCLHQMCYEIGKSNGIVPFSLITWGGVRDLSVISLPLENKNLRIQDGNFADQLRPYVDMVRDDETKMIVINSRRYYLGTEKNQGLHVIAEYADNLRMSGYDVKIAIHPICQGVLLTGSANFENPIGYDTVHVWLSSVIEGMRKPYNNIDIVVRVNGINFMWPCVLDDD